MITLSDSEPSSPTNSTKLEMDIEPDEEWKKILRSRIQSDLQSRTQEVKEELRKSSAGPEDRKRVEEDFKTKLASIKESANDQYQIELEKERNKRRWMAGEPMQPDWSKYLEEEQQHAFDSFKHSRDPPISPTHLQATFRSLSRASRKSYSSTTSFPTGIDGVDFEPDEEWKKQLRSRIQLGFQPKIQHAKDKQLLESRKGMSAEERKRVEDDYKAAMENVKSLANDEYQFELDKERNRRRLATIGEKAESTKLDELNIPWTTKSFVSEVSESSLLSPPQKEPILSRGGNDDLEPDGVWKDKLKTRIQADLKGMVKSANEAHFHALKKAAEAFAQLDVEYKAAMDRIKGMSESRYESELARERLRLRGIAETDAVSDNEESEEESEESEESEKEKEGGTQYDYDSLPPDLKALAASAREKQEHLRRLLEEADKREAEIAERERALLRRDKKLERRQSEARKKEDDTKPNEEESEKADSGKAKSEVKWKDLEEEVEREPDDPNAVAAEKARRKQDAIEDQFRDYDGGDLLEDDLFAEPDPKWVEEQQYIWQQLQYEQQAAMIQRKRQEQRKRQDSMGSDNPSTGSPSSSPIVSKMTPQIPQLVPPPINRSHVPVTPWAPAGFTLASATKPPDSPNIGRKPSLLAFTAPVGIPGSGKPRTGSVSSGSSVPGNISSITHAPSPAPRNVPVVVPPNNLYARVAMVKSKSTQDSPQ